MKRAAVFALNGEPGSFAHAMLTAMDMKNRGYDVRFIVEGKATKLLSLLRDEREPFAEAYKRFLSHGLIDCVCRTCAAKYGVLPAVMEQNLRLADEMSGHPGMARYMEQGYEIVTL